jgi:hypothetical protein
MFDPASDRHRCAAIAARLERVRGTLTDEQFAALVEDVARTALRFEQLEVHHAERVASGPVAGRGPSLGAGGSVLGRCAGRQSS